MPTQLKTKNISFLLESSVYSPLYEGFFLIITGVDSNDEIIELVLTESILLLLMLENWLIEVDI